MKTLILAAALAVSLVGCGRQSSEESQSVCNAPVASTVVGQEAVQMIFGMTPPGGSIADVVPCCSRTEILIADEALVRASYSACDITQMPSGLRVDCLAISDGVLNAVPYTGAGVYTPPGGVKDVGCYWLPPYAK